MYKDVIYKDIVPNLYKVTEEGRVYEYKNGSLNEAVYYNSILKINIFNNIMEFTQH